MLLANIFDTITLIMSNKYLLLFAVIVRNHLNSSNRKGSPRDLSFKQVAANIYNTKCSRVPPNHKRRNRSNFCFIREADRPTYQSECHY